MATTEEVRQEFERLARDRRAAVAAATSHLGDRHPSAVAKALHDGIMAMAESWRAHAIACEASKKRSEGVSFRNGLRAAAELAAGFAGGLLSPEFIASLTDVSSELPAETPDITVPVAVATDGDQILAYLKGETNTVPEPVAVPPMQLGTTAQGALFIEPVNTAVSGGTAIVQPQPFAIPAIIDPEPVVPPRLSWDEFAELVTGLEPPAQGSFSMITSLADCGMKYALDRLARRGAVKASVPQWALVGGTAFHACVEMVERLIMTNQAVPSPEQLWLTIFEAEIKKSEGESGVDPSLWRVSGKGLEGYDWWRVKGAEMLTRYIAYHTPEYREHHRIYVMPDGRPAIELKLTLDLAGLPFEVIIDQVWQTSSGALRIRDIKSGATKQPSTFQLGGNAQALYATLGVETPIAGSFYDARTGSHDLECDDLLTRHPLTELKYRAHAAIQQTRTRAYLPHVSIFGGGCSSCGHRAICPTQAA